MSRISRGKRHPFLTLGLILGFGLIARGAFLDDIPLTPRAAVETEPVASEGDAADDPAIWIHPTDPSRSLVLGTDKKGGLGIYDLDGKRLQVVSDGSRPNNVDVLYGFPLAGKAVDLAVAGTRVGEKQGLAFWKVDPDARRLEPVGPVPAFPVFGGGEPYGSCVYRSPRDHSFYAFVSNKQGTVEQYKLDGSSGSIVANRVRVIEVGSQVEGCVADHDLGQLYLGEEDEGIWKYGAEPDAGSSRTLVAKVGDHGLTADVEGLTMYYASGSKGYLIASSQGSNSYKVYERDGSNAFVATIDPQGGAIGDVGETDGIDVTNVPTSARFARGLFVVQDGKPRHGRQNFKFYAWDEVAGTGSESTRLDRLADPGRCRGWSGSETDRWTSPPRSFKIR